MHTYPVMSRASEQPLQMGSKVIDVIRISLEVSKSGKIKTTLKKNKFSWNNILRSSGRPQILEV